MKEEVYKEGCASERYKTMKILVINCVGPICQKEESCHNFLSYGDEEHVETVCCQTGLVKPEVLNLIFYLTLPSLLCPTSLYAAQPCSSYCT